MENIYMESEEVNDQRFDSQRSRTTTGTGALYKLTAWSM